MAKKIEVKGTNVRVITKQESDYISLTDIAHYKEPGRTDHVIQTWRRNRNTVEFLGIWEQLNNPNFNPLEFEGVSKSGFNSPEFGELNNPDLNPSNSTGLEKPSDLKREINNGAASRLSCIALHKKI